MSEKNISRGTTRSDGKKFWAYASTCLNGEYWVSSEKFEEMMLKRECMKEYLKNWRKDPKNREKREKHKANQANKRKTDEERRKVNRYMVQTRRKNPIANIKHRLRCLIAASFLRRGYKKGSKTEIILGCSWEHLRGFIESQFSNGISWDNRETWHIDHYFPLNLARNKNDLVTLNHWSNLRPFEKRSNILKDDNIPHGPFPFALRSLYNITHANL